MNQIIPTVDESRAVAILHRRPVLVPETMSDAIKLAELMATSKLVPAALQKSAADCLMVIQQAVRWDMDPFAVAQECSVIQGKLMHSGKLVAAVVNARGNLSQRLSYQFTGSGDDRTITVSGQLQGESSPRTVEVTLRNVKTQNTMWSKQTDQQLMYSGARVWARRHTPELMLGVYSPEEFDETVEQPKQLPRDIMHPEDYSDGTPEKLTKPASAPHAVTVSKANGLTGTSPRVERADERWREKIEGWMQEVDQTETVDDLDKWISAHSVEASSIPTRHKDLQQAIYRKVRLHREALIAGQVVHEEDGARQATEADFEPAPLPPEPQSGSISQRAIHARENPSADEIADYLRS